MQICGMLSRNHQSEHGMETQICVLDMLPINGLVVFMAFMMFMLVIVTVIKGLQSNSHFQCLSKPY